MSDTANETVTLEHPDVKEPIEVGPAKAKVLQRQGWKAASKTAPTRPVPQEG